MFALKYIDIMLPSRAVHRSPSHGRALAIKTTEDRPTDPEAAKKAEPPSHRRKQPLVLMFSILFVTFLLGAGLFYSQIDSYSSTGGRTVAAAAAAPAKGPTSIGPEKAWKPLNIHTRTDYDTINAISGSSYVEFTAPGLFVSLK